MNEALVMHSTFSASSNLTKVHGDVKVSKVSGNVHVALGKSIVRNGRHVSAEYTNISIAYFIVVAIC
jgi:hypothetical protein